jgi:hypothetical protein
VVLEVTTKDQDRNQLFKTVKQYLNIGLDAKGLEKFAVWEIVKISEKSTAFKAEETKRETFTIPLNGAKTVEVSARLSYLYTPDSRPMLMKWASKTFEVQ